MSTNILSYMVRDGLLKRRGADPSAWDVLLDQIFDDWTSGDNTTPPSTSYWNSKMGMGTGVGGGSTTNLQDVRLFDLGSGAKCLRFVLPANFSDKGTTMWCQFPRLVNEAKLDYRIRFSPGPSSGGDWAPWGWGGKLPGLGGVDMVGGTSPGYPSGGNGPTITTGWSGRLMWVGRAGDGSSSYSTTLGTRPNLGLLYTYGYDGIGQYGDNRWFATATPSTGSWQSGVWHDMHIHYRMNNLGVADGYLLCTIDGVTVYETSTWMPRNTNANVQISHLWVHIFRGGDTASWGIPTDEYVDIDSMRITTPPAVP